jgi:hypothetical protein
MRIKLTRTFFIIFISTLLLSTAGAQQNLDSLFMLGHQKNWSQAMTDQYRQWAERHFLKPGAGSVRQDAIMNGNKITSLIWNYGSISQPGERIVDIVWEGLGYGYEFGPFVGAEVEVLPGDPHPDVIRIIRGVDTTYIAHIISDGLTSNGGEISPDGNVRWGWQPLVRSDDGNVEYADITQTSIPTSDDKDRDGDGKPDSWPESWYNDDLRAYVWPGALGQGATNADKEAFFVFDDRDNVEFEYYPYNGDSLRKGLGLEVEARIYQWSNVEAEDAIFLIYKIRNKSNKDLPKVIFGMWGDPHIGGPDDYQDDWASFDKKLNMVFAWDADNYTAMNPNIVPGYLGYKFLESPGLANDHIDNDGDGMIDESWTDGIDNDNDWQLENDDVGIDGVPNTGDEGEKDGMPTAGDPFDIRKPGEPNFEFTDIDESDMIGLTSFRQPLFSGLRISNDELMWSDYIQPGSFDSTDVQGDYVFLYASGIFPLRATNNVTYAQISEAIKRFSIALILGEDRNDLELNARTVQRIYNSGYQFAKPPAKPNLTAVPGDRKVLLYWDNVAESSIDPIVKKIDFEGYVIYRSVGYDFLDQQTITDIHGNKFLFEPLKSFKGASARFDLDNEYSGISKTPYTGRGVSYYLGDNIGIRNVYVDSNNVINGQTYYYAVVSYDHGSDSLGIPPSECSKIITYNATTNEYTFDVNTAQVIPRRKAAGYIAPEIIDKSENHGIVREKGFSTGIISVDIIDEVAVKNENKYLIEFDKVANKTVYSVRDTDPIEQTFISFYDNFAPLLYRHLVETSVIVSSEDKQTVFVAGRDYEIDGIGGAIKVFDPQTHPGASMADNEKYFIHYEYFPLWHSTKLDSQQTNTPFNGLKLVVKQSSFGVNEELTDWNVSHTTTLVASLLNPKKSDLTDYEFKFYSSAVDTAVTNVTAPFTITDVITSEKMKFAITEKTVNGRWDPGDAIFILRGGITPANIVWEIRFDKPASGGYVPPAENDRFYLATDKPFSAGDVFSFRTKGAAINHEKAKSMLDNICVVPNPYVGTNLLEPVNPLDRSARGYRRVYFDHLPEKCTIRIYTLAGELIRTLEHEGSIDDGKEFWDLLTRDNMEVAYGLYFFHVDAPGIGETTGKFSIIK